MTALVATMSGGLLDYWTAKAANLEPKMRAMPRGARMCFVFGATYMPSTSLIDLAPLLDQFDVEIAKVPASTGVSATAGLRTADGVSAITRWRAYGPTRAIAICRAIVGSVFGEAVPEVAP